jgi:hypothetical protein
VRPHAATAVAVAAAIRSSPSAAAVAAVAIIIIISSSSSSHHHVTRMLHATQQAACTPSLCSLLCARLHTRRRGRGRHARAEDDEDAELLRDEEGEGSAQVHRLTVQPSILTGGTLREYQMQGLNWLIHLYDNGINGILADEMVRCSVLTTASWAARRARQTRM